MISSVFSLKETNTIPDYLVSIPETKLEENYYFNSCLDFLLECQNELLDCRKEFYTTVLEAENEDPQVINEAFNDILEKIKDIIKKILAYLESIVKRFITALGKFVNADKYIIKMKKELSKFPNDESFTINGYNYTLNDKIPVVDIVGLDLAEVQIAVRDLSKDTNDISVKINKLNTILSEMISEEKIGEARSQIMGVMNNIPDSSFANEVFATYRDGKSTESDIKIRKADVTRAMNDYEGYKTKIKEVNNLKANLNHKYKSLENQVDNIIRTDIKAGIDNSTLDPKTKYILTDSMQTLISNELQAIQRISNYHLQAVAAKLDAYNALMIQDRNILYKALNIVQKNIKNTKIMENYDCYDYTRDAIYKGYLVERYYMNKEQQRFVEECLALSESNIPQLKIVNEDLKMDKKGKFERLKELIKEIFEKFLMKMNSFFKNDKKFLEQYKDVILTKKIEPYTLNNMPEYKLGIKNIKAHKLQKLNVKDILSLDEKAIQQKILRAFEGDDFAEFCKKYFLSNNTPNREKVESSTLNMAELYAFCTSAPATIKVLENDRNEFVSASEQVKNEVLKAATSKNESVDIYGEKYYYSTVLESFINEAEEKSADSGSTTITNNQQSQTSGNPNSDAKMKLDVPSQDNKAEKNANLEKDVKSDDKDTKDAKTQADENKNSDAKKVEETADWYLKALRIVATAKITAFQKIYSEYMKILRYHVRNATGSMGNASKFTEDDVKQLKDAMKEYQKGDKEVATNKIINIYKSKNMVIDDHDVQKLVDQNAKNLE